MNSMTPYKKMPRTSDGKRLEQVIPYWHWSLRAYGHLNLSIRMADRRPWYGKFIMVNGRNVKRGRYE